MDRRLPSWRRAIGWPQVSRPDPLAPPPSLVGGDRRPLQAEFSVQCTRTPLRRGRENPWQCRSSIPSLPNVFSFLYALSYSLILRLHASITDRGVSLLFLPKTSNFTMASVSVRLAHP